jgi:subtilisin family serine protease
VYFKNDLDGEKYMKRILLGKRITYSTSLLLILIINVLFLVRSEPFTIFKKQNVIVNSQIPSYNNPNLKIIPDSFEDLNLVNETIKIMKSSGESYEMSIPTGINTVQSCSINGKTTLFINDQKGGDKIDPKLRDYTFLWDNDYINEDKIQVILLPGSQISHDTYAIKSLSNQDIFQMEERLQLFEGNILSKFNNFPFVAVDLPYSEIFELAEQNFIAHIFLDKKVYVCLDESVPIIKPPTTWQQLETQFENEVNGTNIKIAVLDTGIDKNHPDLDDLDDNSSTFDPKVIAEESFTGEDHTWDGYGHGTHCASIAAGTGEASSYTHPGVAPGALLLNGKVLNDEGSGYDSWIINGIEWAVNQSADIISMSLGKDISGDGTDPVSLALDWANDQGVVCVVSAGNAGTSGMFTVGMPAVAKKVITVGSTTKTDEISSFSSQGPTSDYRIKPDVCAPGSDIVAARATGTSMGSPINSYYTRASGTSMATPHVVGAVALILQIHNDWNPLMIKSALMGNTKILFDEHLWEQGAGRIDVAQAINTTLLIIEPSSSLGFLGLEPLDTNLSLMNLANTPTSIDLSTYTLCNGNETNYVSLNETFLTIPANTNASISLQIDPVDENAPEGWYEGWVNISTSQNNKTAPYLFLAMSSISVSIYDTDDVTPIDATIALTHYPNMSLIEIQGVYDGNRALFVLKSGDYALCAQMGMIDNGSGQSDYSRMFMLEKNITVSKFSNLNISLSLAEAQIHSIPTTDFSGNNLIVHSYTQYFCGGPQTEETYFNLSEWSISFGWSGFDLNISHLTFYSTNFTPPDRLCEALGFYASDQFFSKVYLVPMKFWNVSTLPEILSYPKSDFAKYNVVYDMPETYPENGLYSMNAFWFTWDHLGGFQGWGGATYKVPAGMNATYYLAPGNGTYFGEYMPTYQGWPNFNEGPLQQWRIGRHYPYPQIPLNKSETGNMTLGRFSFAPYHPGLNLSILDLGNEFLLNLTGDIWGDLSWPHSIWYMLSPQQGYISYYPHDYANYSLFINGTIYDQGLLNGTKGFNNEQFISYPPDYIDVDWCGINESWTISGGNVLLQLTLPSLATLFSDTIYNLTFTLGGADSTPPLLNGILCPTNFTPGEDILINFTTFDVGSGVDSHYLKYSFNNGATWQTASYENPYYRVPCIEADALTLLINVTDLAGNSLQFLSNPVALCNKAKLNVPLEILAFIGDPIVISGNLTSVEGNGLPEMTVFVADNNITYTMTDENGTFIILLPPIDDPGNYTYNITSASAGLYEQQEVSIILWLSIDIEPPSWVELPTDQFVEFSDSFNYDLSATDLAGISQWWLNDTFHFSIDSNGVITNNIILPVGVYRVKVWVNDTHSNIQNISFKVIVQDTIPPEWNPPPSDYVIEFGDDLIYDLDATDLSGIDYWWINDTTHFSIDGGGTITNSIELIVGNYWLQVRAYDPYDNYCSFVIKITIKEEDPPLPVISGYDLIFLFGVIFLISVILKKKEMIYVKNNHSQAEKKRFK